MAADPTVAQAYVGGTITLPANTPSNLYLLAVAQLSAECPAAATEIAIYSDAATSSSHTLKIGSTNLVGAVSDTNFGYEVAAGLSRIYRGADAAYKMPVGRLTLFASAQTSVHVEIVL